MATNTFYFFNFIYLFIYFISEYQVCNYGFTDKLLGAYTARHTRLKIAWNTKSN